MGIYLDKMHEKLPVMKHVLLKKGEMIYRVFQMVQWRKAYYEVEYLKFVWEYMENCDGNIRDKSYFLITNQNSVGLKAAFAIWNYARFEGENERKGYQEEMQQRISFVDAKGDYLMWLKGREETECTYFTGLNENDRDELELKLKCIMSSEARIKFIQLEEKYLNKPWARDLLKNKECEIIYLPELKYDYYLKIMNELLEGEKYKLSDSLKRERLVKNIQKKCGSHFCEEDIAWSLDQAEKSAMNRGDFRCLKAEDFKLDSYEYDSPMKKLNAMTGLDYVKVLAHEWEALSREQEYNEKLVDVCKHLVFVGRPGTGKTMCAELLAKIMAEAGQSNGNFIVASRKDIIAEFVGQTAPKIANLFTQARKGVLFIDEAGFLLHNTRSSFNQEAIKEFIRYMELYQDVTVIFALYPGEEMEWMNLDSGLSSRISRIIPFEDYSETELWKIIRKMCRERGYQVSENTEDIIRTYLDKQRRRMGDNFGNAREGRKLVEAAVIARSVRCYDYGEWERDSILTVQDFENAIRRLEQGIVQKKSFGIGFAAGGRENEEFEFRG